MCVSDRQLPLDEGEEQVEVSEVGRSLDRASTGHTSQRVSARSVMYADFALVVSNSVHARAAGRQHL